MPVPAGERLGRYEILAPIGAGGMGEVYRAHDPQLHREVAIKIGAAQFNDRSAREARLIAALNHPNICHIYDVGPNYLVMELVEGPTLAERLQQGRVPLDEALAIARQIAEALEAAHEKGIVHRDLKPANIKIRPDGTVKVLDFGLAKSTEEAPPSANQENSPTITFDAATRTGVIMGTAGYMAPEQARGKPVDKRADIWAFGVVLYEMLTARRLFVGDTASDTLAAVLTRDPDWTSVPPQTERLLRRCLEKDPKQRLRDIADAQYLLDEPARIIPAAKGGLAWKIAAVMFAILSAAALVSLWFFTRHAAPPVLRLSVDLGDDAPSPRAGSPSPSSRRLAPGLCHRPAIVKPRLAIRRRPDRFVPLAGTDGAELPSFRRTGSSPLAEKKLRKPMPAALVTSTLPVRAGSWGDDDNIASPPPTMGSVARFSSGGTPQPVTIWSKTRQRVPPPRRCCPGNPAVL